MKRVPTHAGDWHTLVVFQDVHVPTTDIEMASLLVLQQAGEAPEDAGHLASAIGIAATLYGGASETRPLSHVIHLDYRLADGRFEVMLHRASEEPNGRFPGSVAENGGWQAVRQRFDLWGRPPGAMLLAADLSRTRPI